MSIDLAITLVAAFGIFFLGSIVYFHDRKSFSNVLFFLISLSTVFWSLANYFSLNFDPERVLFWIRMVLFFAAPHAVLFSLFAHNFPNSKILIDKKILISSLVLLVLTMAATLSPFVFSNVEFDGNRVVPIPGPLMPLFALVVLGSLISGIFLIIKKYVKAKSSEKMQWRMMLIGVLTSYLFLIVTNFVLVIFFKNTSFVIFGPLYMLPTIIGMTYAILRHRLLNVKTIATEVLIFIILSISLFDIFTAKEATEIIMKIAIFITFFIFGLFLVRSVLREVEQREKLELLTKELEEKNEKLALADKIKSEFLGFAAHQVKSPMAVVKGYATLIFDGTLGPVSEEIKNKAHKIKETADRLIALVTNLLDMRKMEEGKLEIRFAPMDVSKLLREMVEEYKIVGKEKGLDVQFETNKELIEIEGDEQKLRQVFQNLIDNSIKYTPKGYVKISVKDEGQQILVTLQDSGRGMSQELQRKLFQQFVRDEKTKNQVDGTGLGLYLAKQIVLAHHGEIKGFSAGENMGSTFTVRLGKK
ncbi:MAG: ATP-binding protein [Patescibacteria group bacterium]